VTETFVIRRRVVLASVLGIVAGSGAIATVAGADRATEVPRQPPRRITTEVIGGVAGSQPSVSGDGRFVVFSAPTGEEARPTSVFLQDRETGDLVELTRPAEGVRPGASVHPVISRDGCVAAVTTEMSLDVFRDDDAGSRWDVYRITLPHCGGTADDWELVSTLGPFAGGRDDVVSDQPVAMSASGAIVAFTHPAPGLSPDLGISAITVVDLTVPVDDPGRYSLAAGLPFEDPDTTYLYRGMDQPALSGDGRYLAFRSDTTASEAVPSWGGGPVEGGYATRQVYVWDRGNDDPFRAVLLASARNNTPSVAGASDPAISEDGSVVAFESSSIELVDVQGCGGPCPSQIYRLDRDTDDNDLYDEPGREELTMVSVVAAADAGPGLPQPGDGASSQPALNADGSIVAFVSRASNLLPVRAPGGGQASDGDVLLADARSGAITRATTTADGLRPAVAAHAHPQLSDTGRVLVLDTLVAGQLTGWPGIEGRYVVALTSLPTLTLAPLDVGVVTVGYPGQEWYMAVINEGPTAFRPASVKMSSPNFLVSGGTCTKKVFVPAGGDCTVYLIFTPTVPGAVSGRLTISEDGYAAQSISTTVTGTGGEPAITIEPAGVTFQPTVVGTASDTKSFDVKNISIAPTSVANFEIIGENAADFAVEEQSCIRRPLNPAKTCGVEVSFTPTGSGRRTALLRSITTVGYATTVLSGDGYYAPRIEVQDDTVRQGESIGVGGEGFPVDTTVTLVFADSWGRSVTVDTNEEGRFLAVMELPQRERTGERTLVAQTADGVSTSVFVEILRSTREPRERDPRARLGGG
jgi:Tol biopolymer transport system component